MRRDVHGIRGPRPTAELLRLYVSTQNPVTKSVYLKIIGNRIDEAVDLQSKLIKRLEALK